MKILLNTVIIFLLITGNSYSQSYEEIKKGKRQYRRNGKSKEFAFSHKIKSKKVYYENALQEMYLYDVRGNNTELIRYHEHDTSTQRFIYVFDDNDKMTESFYYGVYTGWPTKVEYKYDGKNNKIKLTEFDPRLKMSKITSWVFSKENNLLKIITINHRGDTSGIIKNSYNSFGRRIKSEHFINTRIFDQLYEYKYDAVGNLAECSVYDNVGFVRKEIYNFDESGKIIKEYEIDNNMVTRTYYEKKDTNGIKNPDKNKFDYDSKGNVLKKYFVTDNDELILTNSYEYDENGNMLKEINYEGDEGYAYIRTFKYDDSGNLIRECGEDGMYNEDDKEKKIIIGADKKFEYCTNYEYEFYE